MSDFSLEAIDVGKAYQEGSGDALHVLSDIDLHLHHGETVAIIGSSGSGKTTLLNTLGGLDEPTTGKVLLNGDDIAKHSEKTRCTIRNKHFGFIYQFHHLLPEFTALENVAMPLLIGGVSPEIASQRSDRKNAEQAIELIIQLNQSYNTALVIVTHDLQIAERMSRIYTLEDGVLAAQ